MSDASFTQRYQQHCKAMIVSFCLLACTAVLLMLCTDVYRDARLAGDSLEMVIWLFFGLIALGFLFGVHHFDQGINFLVLFGYEALREQLDEVESQSDLVDAVILAHKVSAGIAGSHVAARMFAICAAMAVFTSLFEGNIPTWVIYVFDVSLFASVLGRWRDFWATWGAYSHYRQGLQNNLSEFQKQYQIITETMAQPANDAVIHERES